MASAVVMLKKKSKHYDRNNCCSYCTEDAKIDARAACASSLNLDQSLGLQAAVQQLLRDCCCEHLWSSGYDVSLTR